MLSKIVTVGCLLIPAMAVPNPPYGNHYTGSGRTQPTGGVPSGGFYSNHNGTGPAQSTGKYQTYTPADTTCTDAVTAETPLATAADTGVESCSAGTTTVTVIPTVTITVGAGSSTAPSAYSGASAAASAAATSAAPVTAASSAPAVAAASSAANTTVSTGNSTAPAVGFKTKRGIVASGNLQNQLTAAMCKTPKISWVCDWYSGAPDAITSDVIFVPQNYGKQSDVNGDWTKNAQAAVKKGTKYFLSFGEPGTPNAQLYMDPQDAVTLWMQKMEPYAKQGVTIGAPGTLQNTQDFEWLTQFLDLCTECTIGFLAMHWYDKAEPGNVQGFKDTINKAIALGKGKPVWLDNFQASGTAEAQQQFLQEVIPWMDSNPSVQAYGYVPTDDANFVDSNGNLNALGQLYGSM